MGFCFNVLGIQPTLELYGRVEITSHFLNFLQQRSEDKAAKVSGGPTVGAGQGNITARYRMSKIGHLETAICVLKYKHRLTSDPQQKFRDVPAISSYRIMLKQAWADRKVNEKPRDMDSIDNWLCLDKIHEMRERLRHKVVGKALAATPNADSSGSCCSSTCAQWHHACLYYWRPSISHTWL